MFDISIQRSVRLATRGSPAVAAHHRPQLPRCRRGRPQVQPPVRPSRELEEAEAYVFRQVPGLRAIVICLNCRLPSADFLHNPTGCNVDNANRTLCVLEDQKAPEGSDSASNSVIQTGSE